jgi:hypothetical protein
MPINIPNKQNNPQTGINLNFPQNFTHTALINDNEFPIPQTLIQKFRFLSLDFVLLFAPKPLPIIIQIHLVFGGD